MRIVILFGLFLSLTFIFSSCSDDKAVPKITSDTTNLDIQPDQISTNVEVTFVDSNFTKAILHADIARVYQAKMETILDGNIKVEFMSKQSKKKVSTLTSDSVKIDDKTKNMLAMGHVIVYSDSTRRKLETSVLEWENKTQKLYSTEFVKITSPEERLQGYGFESDQHLANYRIFRVSGEQRKSNNEELNK